MNKHDEFIKESSKDDIIKSLDIELSNAKKNNDWSLIDDIYDIKDKIKKSNFSDKKLDHILNWVKGTEKSVPIDKIMNESEIADNVKAYVKEDVLPLLVGSKNSLIPKWSDKFIKANGGNQADITYDIAKEIISQLEDFLK
jgi:hypothetical protein